MKVEELEISFQMRKERYDAVRGVSFELKPGERLGIVGESGSGKSVTARTLMRLIPSHNMQIRAGRVLFEGKDLLKASEKEMQAVRGRDIGMIFQDPMTSLNPTMKIGEQIAEGLLHHFKEVTVEQARERTLQMLAKVGIPEPEQRIDWYPHELSGGQRQRVMIAIALITEPKVLIADEPTTALDVTIQAQILDLMKELQEEFGMSVILITHDLGVVAEFCERVLVMYAGQIIEEAATEELFRNPQHPYTQGLLKALPHLDSKTLTPIPGSPPRLSAIPSGCAFHPRCPHAMKICPMKVPPRFGAARCWLHDPKREVK